MTAADRLRAAADRLDSPILDTPQGRAAAALLRAVADDIDWGNAAPEPIQAAALALADSILGGTDE